MSETNCKNYPSILRKYTTVELREIINDSLVQICYYYDEESPRHEIKDIISANEKTLLSDIMYGALLEIRFRDDIKSDDDAEFFVGTVISTTETIADRVYKRMFRRRLQGYVSVYLPLWGILDRLVADEGK